MVDKIERKLENQEEGTLDFQVLETQKLSNQK
jgi:hypothetical protein